MNTPSSPACFLQFCSFLYALIFDSLFQFMSPFIRGIGSYQEKYLEVRAVRFCIFNLVIYFNRKFL